MSALLKTAEGLAPDAVSTVLVVTVGGTPHPIVYAILQQRPDYLVFLCSADQKLPMTRGSYQQVEGMGKVCSRRGDESPSLPNIRVQAYADHLPYDIVILEAIDDLKSCYQSITRVFEELRARFPAARLYADYTGGTKTMSAALASAAIDDGNCQITVVSGDREDLIKVGEGTQFLRPTETAYIHVRRELKRANDLMASFDYSGLENLMREISRYRLAEEQERDVRILTTLSRAFEAWDRFDHLPALQLLNHHRGTYVEYVKFLEAICSSRKAIDPDFDPSMVLRGQGEFGEGVEIVEDLVLNAQRRAVNRRFDDALGRLYRATEMLVQIHLKRRYGLSTGNLDPAQLPEAVREAIAPNPHTGLRQTALRNSYELLQYFEGDPLWPVYEKRKLRLINALNLRNASLFAHGFTPIRYDEYREAEAELTGLITEGIEASVGLKRYARVRQFPPDLLAAFREAPLETAVR